MIDRLALIGVGLIGGSLVRALKAKQCCREVVGCGRDVDNLNKAVALGVIDRYETDPAKAVLEADMVVLAVPLGAMRSVVQKIVPHLSADVVVTDVGSGKASVIADVQYVTGHTPPWFVPGHPIAGTEKSGVEASFATLFERRRVILTPLPDTASSALEKVRTMWQDVGAEVTAMAVEQHDRILAATSHLPHMLAFSLVNQLADMDQQDDVFRFAAGGFRDFSRIASSDPVMWKDICFGNRGAIIDTIKAFQTQLDQIVGLMESGRCDELQQLFRRSKQARDDFGSTS